MAGSVGDALRVAPIRSQYARDGGGRVCSMDRSDRGLTDRPDPRAVEAAVDPLQLRAYLLGREVAALLDVEAASQKRGAVRFPNPLAPRRRGSPNSNARYQLPEQRLQPQSNSQP